MHIFWLWRKHVQSIKKIGKRICHIVLYIQRKLILANEIPKGITKQIMNASVMVLGLNTLSNVDRYSYKVSWRYLERFSSYRVDTLFMMDKASREIIQKG